jgi:transposase
MSAIGKKRNRRVVPGRARLEKLSKARLIELIIEEREAARLRLEQKDKRIAELSEQLATLQREHDEQSNERKIRDINKQVNEPSSKKPEWDKDGNPKPPNNRRKRKCKKRPGCGNGRKSNVVPDETNDIPLDACPCCGTDLQDRQGTKRPGRIVEDIAPPAEKTTVSEEITQSKWCPKCKKMVSSKTERALPGSDIGLNATLEMAYLWVMSALSLPRIQDLVRSFRALNVSTAGISKMMIRLSAILQPVYDEILQDVRQGARIWADETGWRIRGKLWWLWIFANERSAYYWADKTRGSPVVEQILGVVFYGILIVDGWHAYTKIVCDRQTCMAHIFRKIRAFIDAYPQYRSILTFYLKLRKIIRDAEKLQAARAGLEEMAFRRRLKALQRRLDELLKWNNPNDVLKEVIKKVRRQKEHILTFVNHDGASHHNNYGEYIIKKGVVKRKMSGGSMSPEGVRAYACIQSVAMTCQLRNISFHRFLKASLVNYIRTGKPMLLAEYEACMKSEVKAA